MRMMMTFKLPVEKGNQAFKDGSLAKVMESLMGKLKPEAAYFAPMEQQARPRLCCFDMAPMRWRASSSEA